MSVLKNGLIDIHHLTSDEIYLLLDLSAHIKKALKNKEVSRYRLAEGKDLLLALLFFENSTRTRSSFEIAALRLGMKLTGLGALESSSVQKGESLAHTLDMYEAYMCDTVVLRHPLDGAAKYASERIKIPVFNAGDGKRQHPTQTVLDLFTVKERTGRLNNLQIGIGGDLKYGRTAHTLAIALSMFPGNVIHLCSPPSLSLPEPIINLLKERDTPVYVHEKLETMLPELDIFYQTRIQKERIPDMQEFEEAKKAAVFRVEHMNLTKENFGLMHPLPIDKNYPGIMSELDHHPKSIYKEQAGNGVPTRMVEIALALELFPQKYLKAFHDEPVFSEKFYKELPLKISDPKKGVSIRPIRKNGIVIDHLKPHTEAFLADLLRVKERKDIYRAGTVRSVSRPDHVKGILMIEDRVLNDDELRIIATLSPGARVNTIENGSVRRKIEVFLPDLIKNVPSLQCPNKGCITRREHKEHVNPEFEKIGNDTVRCLYCDHIFSTSELLSE